MDHFVCHGPIRLQIRQGCLTANRNGDKSNWRAKRSTIVNASALASCNSYGYVRHRISTKIGSDRLGGGVDPPNQIFGSGTSFLRSRKHINDPARSHDGRQFVTAGIASKCERPGQQRNL